MVWREPVAAREQGVVVGHEAGMVWLPVSIREAKADALDTRRRTYIARGR